MNKTTAIVFFSIIVVGLTISLFTLNKCGKPVEVIEDPVATGETIGHPTEEKKGETATVTAPPVKESAAPGTDESAPLPTKADGYASPVAAMKALSGAITKKDFKGFTEIVGKEAIDDSIRAEVKALIEAPELELSKDKPISEISKSASIVRWALNFVPGEGVEASGAPQQLYADLASVGENSVAFEKISLPLLPAAVKLSGESPVAGENSDNAAPGDPLSIAHAFSKAVIARDFRVARALSDPGKVTDERVAALMIAVEEGGFQLKEDRPLVVTLSREDITWVLARIVSGQQTSEFALELGQDSGEWTIGGLTFSKVLSALAAQAGGGDVAYSPIVEDPAGGDSLVLYFEFDSAGVTPRGKRQLAIIADILSQGEERVIRINGHTDALGTDQYNAGLSDGRADAIRAALLEMGVAPEQVITEAFGSSKPRRPNFNPDGTDNPTGRSQNRRAEVYLDF
ncbi:MAG: OmpA family protein [Verrucomicrobiales bacterium]|nr:OmpA family protein [Verrucomicrobiales bacterium]